MNGPAKLILSALGTTALLLGVSVTSLACPATISTGPYSGPPGSGTQVYGQYFGEGAAVQIHWGNASGPLLGIGYGPTFYIHVATPANAAAGSYSIVAVGQDSTGAVIRSGAYFTVATPVPAAQAPAKVAPVAQPHAAVWAAQPAVRSRSTVWSRAVVPPPANALPMGEVVAPPAAATTPKTEALGMRRALTETPPASLGTLASATTLIRNGPAVDGGSFFAGVMQAGWPNAAGLGLIAALLVLAIVCRRRTGASLEPADEGNRSVGRAA